MARRTSGWLLGVRVSAEMGDAEEDGTLLLVHEWGEVVTPEGVVRQREMEAEVAAGTRRAQDVLPRDEFIPVNPRLGDGAELLGFWVAIGGSGKPGVPSPDRTVAADEVATTEPYATSYALALGRWNRFARWCDARGVPLPPPRLWLAETEVA